MGHLLRALSLLTVLPVRARWDGDPLLGRSMAAFPLVGVLIGGLVAAVTWLLSLIPVRAATPLVAILALAVAEGLTGFLHLDGWADTCDSLLPPLPRERRLEVMEDPRLGAFGVVGLLLLLATKAAALYALLERRATSGGSFLPLAGLLIAIPALGRLVVVAGAAALPLAPRAGMAAPYRRGLGAWQLVLASATAAAAAALPGWRLGVVCAAASGVAALAVALTALRRIGGATGDVYGAMIEAAETAALAAAALAG